MKKITFIAFTCLLSTLSFGQVVINEIDSDQTSTDIEEFIELKSDNPNAPLDGYVVVLFNGSNDKSYAAYDLDGYTTDATGFLLLANDGFPGQDISLGANNGLQNGVDAVAIYNANDTDFPNGTSATSTNLIDAIVYGTGSDDTDLLNALSETIQYDENENGNKLTESIQRDSDGTFCVGAPTPDATNIDCGSTCPLTVYVTDVLCDDTTNSTDTYTTILAFEGGGTESYTITSTEGFVGGDDPSSLGNGTITITGVTEGNDFSYTIASNLCTITHTITAPNCEPASEVATIAALRQGNLGETYTLTGEAVITYARDATGRNQKYIQDETDGEVSGILIDDPDGVITGTYAIGDVISNITGELVDYNGVLELVPIQDISGAISTGNSITPQTITVTDFNADPNAYESELIAFENISFTDADGTATFSSDPPVNYDFQDANSEVAVFRTNFSEAGYIDQVIPTGAINLVGLGSEYNGTAQLFARDSDDIDANLATERIAQDIFTVYPNPASNGFINISTVSNETASVAIFNILGKQVLSKELNNQAINVSGLQSGIYLIKVTQKGKSTTKKLVIK